MCDYIDFTELYHHGIKGQKWGVRRYQNEDGSLTFAGQKQYSASEKEQAYRKKLSNILSKDGINDYDRKLLKYRNANVGTRIAKSAATSFAPKIIGNTIAGVKPTKESIARLLITGTLDTATKFVTNDLLAKSASKGYSDDGKRADGKKDTRKITKEQKIVAGLRVASGMAYVGTIIGGYKLQKAAIDRKKNEARFAKWGPNILTDNVKDYSNVIDLSSDMWKIVE